MTTTPSPRDEETAALHRQVEAEAEAAERADHRVGPGRDDHRASVADSIGRMLDRNATVLKDLAAHDEHRAKVDAALDFVDQHHRETLDFLADR